MFETIKKGFGFTIGAVLACGILGALGAIKIQKKDEDDKPKDYTDKRDYGDI